MPTPDRSRFRIAEISPGREMFPEGLLKILACLHDELSEERKALLADRERVQSMVDASDFSPLNFATGEMTQSDWRVSPLPPDLRVRQVELTSPPAAKLIINGLNSGADAYIADFDDSLSPTWSNVMTGHRNLRAAVAGSLSFVGTAGKQYIIRSRGTKLFFRPRGLHLEEKHATIDGVCVSAPIFDVGLFVHHCAVALHRAAKPVCLYIPKIESAAEAAFWNKLLTRCEDLFHLPRQTLKAAAIIETVMGAFQIEPILHALRERSIGISCGRWDYIFSHIRTLNNHPLYILPDREEIAARSTILSTLANTVLRVAQRRDTCAIGFMSAYIPARIEHEEDRQARRIFEQEKAQEAADGFDGTWIAHPSLVTTCRRIFSDADRSKTSATAPLDTATSRALLTPPRAADRHFSLRHGVRVCLHYFSEWAAGRGAIRLNDRMEDTATAEIWRCQIWQRLHQRDSSSANPAVTIEDIREMLANEMRGVPESERSRYSEIAQLLDTTWTNAELVPHFTDILYERMP